ncbi:TonB-dependent receptor, partial [Vibrio vulnificus]|uniref:TonB-dependent receptor domain-containing protein n=1 Tax=Vibrio vulnificus TaxID=672 RepID=UPI0019D4EA49
DDRSENNFNGTFSFINLSNYRDTLQGLSYPTQFRITVGNPLQSVSRTDFGLFVTDDWRIAPSFTLSLGLRYENQTNISDNFNFAPRIS